MPGTILALVLLLCVAVYWPGTSGDFLFDDWVNLRQLGRYGGVHDWDSLLLYLMSGVADPTGRPLSQLSFLLDARDWPADPWPFKRTNILLHVANGALLYSVLTALGRRLPVTGSHARLAALVATAAWVLHPLWVSTVLYVIQRQAMLAALFVLLGMRAWIAGRDASDSGRFASAWFWAVLAVPVCALLAGLSKANGLLLPVLLLALEATVLRPRHPESTAGRYRNLILLALPSVALCMLLIWQATGTESIQREWTLGQRLLTQPRALFDYAYRLIVPGLDATGLFADGFRASHGWFTPPATLPAILGLIAIAVVAWWARARHTPFAAAVLFYLGGHLMESGILPLELYFEHRNYLPAALLFWPAALWLAAPGKRRHLSLAAAVGFIFVCAGATAAQAKLWGNPEALAREWARQLPDSARAQANAASYDAAAGRHQAVINRLEPLLASHPAELQFALATIDARCALDKVTHGSIATVEHALQARGLASDLGYRWLVALAGPERASVCSRLPDLVLRRWVVAGLAGPGPTGTEAAARRQRIVGLFALRTGDCPAATSAFNARLVAQRRPEFAQEQVVFLATWCGAESALAHLRHYKTDPRPLSSAPTPVLRLRDWLVERRGFWAQDLDRLERQLEAEQASAEQ